MRRPGGEIQIEEETRVPEAAEAAAEEQEGRKEMKRATLEQIQEYANASTCRREYLLRYLGDEFTGPCGSCDNCEAVDPAVGTRREVVE